MASSCPSCRSWSDLCLHRTSLCVMVASLVALLALLGLHVAHTLPATRSLSPYAYDLSPMLLDMGLRGASSARLQRFMRKLHAGEHVHIVMLGGSFSMPSPYLWFDKVLDALRFQFPTAPISSFNSAYGGTTPAYSVLCLDAQMPHNVDVDLVFLEFNNNDGTTAAGPANMRWRTNERLMRKLLNWRGRPAVVVHSFLARAGMYRELGYWSTSEGATSAIAEYYGQPFISMRSALYHLQRENRTGFTADVLRSDGFHFSALGHKYAADFAVRLLENAGAYLNLTGSCSGGVVSGSSNGGSGSSSGGSGAAQPGNETQAAADREQEEHWVPEPMLAGNHPPVTKLCAIKDGMQELVVKSEGWDYGAEDRRKVKFGYIANDPGATISVALNTSMHRGSDNATHAILYVAFLKSYTDMGMARVSCVSGCECAPLEMQAAWDEHWSLTLMEHMLVTQADRCVLEARVLNQTVSGKYKFKILGFIVSELTSHPDEVQWFFGHEDRRGKDRAFGPKH